MPILSGNPGGEGNPPGKNSPGYKGKTNSKGHFVSNASYRGNMHVGGIKESPPVVGNQPKQRSQSDANAWANKENSI